MKVLVTGGAGFIGANLTRDLVQAGHEVVIMDDLSSGSLSNLAGIDARIITGSILSKEDCTKAMATADSVVHLAAIPSVPRSVRDPFRSHEANATGTLRVLEEARARNCHTIVASSSSVYGLNPSMPKREELTPMPASPYAVSKLASESYACAYQTTYKLPTIAFRFFNVYGPLQSPGHAYAAVIPAFLEAALNGRALRIEGTGNQSRDFTHVSTVCKVLVRALEEGTTSTRPINLALGTKHTVNELASIVRSVAGSTLDVQYVEERQGDVAHSQASSARLCELFPGLQGVPLVQGVQETAEWMKSTQHS